MKQVIAINSHLTTNGYLVNLLNSIGDYKKYPVIVLRHGKWELECLRWFKEDTNYDEMFLLHDTTVINDLGLFDIVFDLHRGKSVSLSSDYCSYLGKYCRSVLEEMEIPASRSKIDSIRYEGAFNREYVKRCKQGEFISLFGDFGRSFYRGNRIEEVFGEQRMVSENEFIKKYKGIYNADKLKQYKERLANES